MALINGRVSIEKLASEFEKSRLDSDKQKLKDSISTFDSSIEFQNVSFNYPNREKTLNNINLKISKNTSIGVRGETGSGKSTIIKLLMGLLQPDFGKILIDGKELNIEENDLKTNPPKSNILFHFKSMTCSFTINELGFWAVTRREK